METLEEMLEVRDSPGNSGRDQKAFPPETRPASDLLCMCQRHCSSCQAPPPTVCGLRGEEG